MNWYHLGSWIHDFRNSAGTGTSFFVFNSDWITVKHANVRKASSQAHAEPECTWAACFSPSISVILTWIILMISYYCYINAINAHCIVVISMIFFISSIYRKIGRFLNNMWPSLLIRTQRLLPHGLTALQCVGVCRGGSVWKKKHQNIQPLSLNTEGTDPHSINNKERLVAVTPLFCKGSIAWLEGGFSEKWRPFNSHPFSKPT